jgi:hypothetical protein
MHAIRRTATEVEVFISSLQVISCSSCGSVALPAAQMAPGENDSKSPDVDPGLEGSEFQNLA